jgi:hypothetical protein
MAGSFGFSEVSDKAFGQTDGDVDALCAILLLEGSCEGACAGRVWDKVGFEMEMLLCEEEGCGEMLWS